METNHGFELISWCWRKLCPKHQGPRWVTRDGSWLDRDQQNAAWPLLWTRNGVVFLQGQRTWGGNRGQADSREQTGRGQVNELPRLSFTKCLWNPFLCTKYQGSLKEEQDTVSALKEFPVWFDVTGTNMYKKQKKKRKEKTRKRKEKVHFRGRKFLRVSLKKHVVLQMYKTLDGSQEV